MKGLVIKNTGSWYQVKTDDGGLFECKIKGNLRLKDIKSTNPIAIGDFVEFSLVENNIGLISAIYDRKNYLIRRSSNLSKHSQILAANLDLVILVITVKYPETSTIFIDRFIASAEAYNIPACIVINKIDLYTEEELQYTEALKILYESIDYPVFMLSAILPESFGAFRAYLQDKTILISGNSGVGKSTLINAILPKSLAKTGEISSYHNKGTHTTTYSQLYQLENGAQLIDTPGIKGFGTIDMEEDEISHYFKEIFKTSKNCRFTNCTHVHEPGCAVLKAVENHEISVSRYQSYLSILSDFKSGKYR
ncbi:MAG: ribosome small subunit-dependent GTPase A [Paludibacter sp.]|nr:ribosome small subunit-dependent GTPase A [Paludibacter sp.]MDD4198146.1 ribosome small subunit-dependent GTPase A [Paludibacter sp.]MDD4427358.1 ribosome small subunit-dependent GTPase A [Paludibacter sp.]